MKSIVALLFLSLFCFTAQGQKKILDSVQVKQLQALNHMDGKYVLKIGTVYLDTRKSYADSLFSLQETVVISNGDKTIDVLHNDGYEEKQDIIPVAENYSSRGFDDFKIAKLSLDSFKIKYFIEEDADDRYTITLGSFNGVVPLSELLKILSIKGVRSVWDASSKKYTYLYGVYFNQASAKKTVLQFANNNITTEILRFEKGFLSLVKPSKLYTDEELSYFQKNKDVDQQVDTKNIVFRVQVGTFSGAVPMDKFRGREILIFPFGNSINKCFSGSFASYRDAYKHKLELNKDGFNDAFIVVYKDGVKLSVGEFVTKEEYQKIVDEFREN